MTFRTLFVILLALGLFSAGGTPVLAQDNPPAQQQSQPSVAPPPPGMISPDDKAPKQQDLLRDHDRIEGRVVIPAERARVLIQLAGRVCRYFHEVLLHWGGAILLIGALVVLAIAYMVLGRIRISAGRSGWIIERFTPSERFSHWLTAISFVLLGLTGLNVTFGKLVLMPLIGHAAFSAVAEIAKYIHNFVSFAFVAGLFLIAKKWMRDNLFNKNDWIWIKNAGGFLNKKHLHVGRFNAGEKFVFWFVLFAGASVAITGYLLLFPFYVTDILGMQIAQVIHAVLALVFIAVIFGHVYIGTLGMEGAFDSMKTGSVDVNWAKEHHDLWLEEELAKGKKPVPPAGTAGSPAE